MFRITRDPSSGSFIQLLANITVMVLSCPLTWTYSMLWQHIRCNYSKYAAITSTITVILSKHRLKLPDDGSLVIRNMSEQF